ncbi:hypothetical protein YTPLAS18_31630 [Nitrospira sp.]|nr:hypothetical protein YTPLAS18_31630 [Nitrospira sp.]
MVSHACRPRRSIRFLGSICVLALFSCHPPAPPPPTVDGRGSTDSPAPFIARLAIVSPETGDGQLAAAYAQLEAETFVLKSHRPSLQIVDRSQLGALVAEQELQLSGSVAEPTALEAGRLLGADGLLAYRIYLPTMRDRVSARFTTRLPPVRIFAKLLRVDTGEVLFHHSSVVPMPPLDEEASWADMAMLVQDAFDKGVNETVAALDAAVR